MKITLVALTLALVSSLAHADLAEDHAKSCQGSEAVSLAGDSGSCRVVIAPKPIVTEGYCVGLLMGSLPCALTYMAIKEGAYMNLTCGMSNEEPVINEDMMAEALGYNIATLISNPKSKDTVISDSNKYSLISNAAVDLRLTESRVNGISKKTGQIGISLKDRVVQLENIVCN